jgi:type I restriction-modification system DNA methylase subunit
MADILQTILQSNNNDVLNEVTCFILELGLYQEEVWDLFMLKKQHKHNITEGNADLFLDIMNRLDKWYDTTKTDVKKYGRFYTNGDIAFKIFTQLTGVKDNLKQNMNALDFACGSGRMYFALLDTFDIMNVSLDEVIGNMFAVDVDEKAIHVLKLKLLCYCRYKQFFQDKKIVVGLQQIQCKDILLNDIDYFQSFDIIVSNPPWKSLKGCAFKKQLQDCGRYKYSLNGMSDLYAISIERILQLLGSSAYYCLICPAGFLCNISNSKLRTHLLSTTSLLDVSVFPETSKLFSNVSKPRGYSYDHFDCFVF